VLGLSALARWQSSKSAIMDADFDSVESFVTGHPGPREWSTIIKFPDRKDCSAAIARLQAANLAHAPEIRKTLFDLARGNPITKKAFTQHSKKLKESHAILEAFKQYHTGPAPLPKLELIKPHQLYLKRPIEPLPPLEMPDKNGSFYMKQLRRLVDCMQIGRAEILATRVGSVPKDSEVVRLAAEVEALKEMLRERDARLEAVLKLLGVEF